jgi:hypothetical protein
MILRLNAKEDFPMPKENIMPTVRAVKQIVKSRPTLEGAGVFLNRVFGFGETSLYDPFLLLDDFRSDEPERYIKGFPWHPHRGIETITYMLAGEVAHGDSMGNEGVIGPGDVQWMTAGSGIIHQEMPEGDGEGRMYGFQLWANLPAAHKMMDPRYREVTSTQIPEAALDGGVVVKVIAGEVSGVRGPVRDIVIDPEYLDVTVPGNGVFRHAVKGGHTVFAYIIEGRGNFGPGDAASAAENGTLVLFDEGEAVLAAADKGPLRFLLISGKPIGEPVAWQGPIVMNTRKELETAFEEYRRGTFIKHAK